MAITRRELVRRGAMGVSVSFLAPELLVRSAFGSVAPHRMLVVLQLDGGNDAINTFIPYTDPKYRSLRPTLAIADNTLVKVDDRMALHPSLAGIKPLYDARKFAYVTNVGFKTLDRSHFHCRDVWQTAEDSYAHGTHGTHGPTGWLGRYADLYAHDATSLTTLSIGSSNALGIVAEHVVPMAVANAESFDVLTDSRYPGDRSDYLASLRAIYGHDRSSTTESIRMFGEETFDAIDLLKSVPPPSATAGYPSSALGRAFQLTAQIASGNVGTLAVWLRFGGFDTHATQANTHAQLLATVADCLVAFDKDLNDRGIADDVLLLAWSEFGRRVQENASAGTDHGKAGTVFLMGNAVNGGTFYGDVPNLSALDQGDLRTEIDFRSIYWTIIRDWFGNDPLPVLKAPYETLGFIATMPEYSRSVRRRR